MSKIFNRTDPSLLTIYANAVDTWESSGDDEKLSMAINLRCDHRISETRERHFRDYFARHNDLKPALDDYVREQVKFASPPHFCAPWCDNLVADAASGTCCAHFDDKNTDLATVINLNGLATPIKDTSPNAVHHLSGWKDLLDSETQANDALTSTHGDKFDEWINSHLEGKPLDEVQAFLKNIFDLLNYRLRVEKKYYNPVWVTTWDKFQQYTSLAIDRWNEVVGVPRNMPCWQIVIKYPASKVPCLHRPSQLDCGFNANHFPSPPMAPMATGGLTMDLHQSTERPLREFIHTQIELDIQYWIDTGRLIGKTGITADELSTMRNTHYQKLKDDYGVPSITAWMTRPI